jgi:hypothetical protein
MARITIDIDTDTAEHELRHNLEPMHDRRRRLSLPTVGIVSSIPFTNWANDFNAGLNPPGHNTATIAIRDNLGYVDQDIDDAISYFAAANLIVTVGGKAPCMSANNNAATPPFISLIAGTDPDIPLPGSGQFKGAVSIESFRDNPRRLVELLGLIGTTDVRTVCLLTNSTTSRIYQDERDNWQGQIQPVQDPSATLDVATAYSNAFTAISAMAPAVQGVVVSTYTWFYQTMPQLVTAADGWIGTGARYVCYPFKEYDISTASHRTHHVRKGPKLKSAYRRLGRMARRYLNSGDIEPIEIEPEAP